MEYLKGKLTAEEFLRRIGTTFIAVQDLKGWVPDNGFIKYNQKLFPLEDQHRLKSLIDFIKAQGAYYILTNAAHTTIYEIFHEESDRCLELNRASLIGGENARGREPPGPLFFHALQAHPQNPMSRRAYERRNPHGASIPGLAGPSAGDCMEQNQPLAPPYAGEAATAQFAPVAGRLFPGQPHPNLKT